MPPLDVSTGAAKAAALPAPRQSGGMPLYDALKARHSTREFADRPLPAAVLSNLLWCAWGVNRPWSGDHTAPSWRHSSEVDLYVFTADGVWLYDPRGHRLIPRVAGNHRTLAGLQDFVAAAPLNLIYVADLARMEPGPEAEHRNAAFTDAGFIGQNVYLFCASEGLATVFRGMVDRRRLHRFLGLTEDQRVTYGQTVGYPASATPNNAGRTKEIGDETQR